MHRAFQRATERLEWNDDDDHFRAWCEGRTGYPIVDAAMRQLMHTGWMRNRLRMIVAMFLSKNLFLDWRRGERFFMQHLIDGDLSANNGGWQWSASTGCDAQPYFRIFNPVTQSKKFDPEGVFIRSLVPELSRVPDKYLHEPWKMPPEVQRASGCVIGQAYPPPVVDHAVARKKALSMYASVRSAAAPRTTPARRS